MLFVIQNCTFSLFLLLCFFIFHQNLFLIMKRTFAKWSLQSLVAMCLVVAGLFFSADAKAQGALLQGQAYSTNGINFLTEQDAIPVLKNKVESLSVTFLYQTPGTPAYNDTLRRLAYYKKIMENISNGTDVAGSLVNSLGSAATLGGSVEAGTTTPQQLGAVFNEAKLLLKSN